MAPPERRYRHAACNDSSVPRWLADENPAVSALDDDQRRQEANHQSSVDSTRRGRKVTIGARTVPIWADGEWAEPAKRPDTPLLGSFILLFPFTQWKHMLVFLPLTFILLTPPSVFGILPLFRSFCQVRSRS